MRADVDWTELIDRDVSREIGSTASFDTSYEYGAVEIAVPEGPFLDVTDLFLAVLARTE